MPALQVRDFPEDLYEELKKCADRNPRSIAQQTIVAVEEMLERQNELYFWDGRQLHRPVCPNTLDFDSEAQRAKRIAKRLALFERIGALQWHGPKPTADEIVELVHEGRRERDRQISDALKLSCDKEV